MSHKWRRGSSRGYSGQSTPASVGYSAHGSVESSQVNTAHGSVASSVRSSLEGNFEEITPEYTVVHKVSRPGRTTPQVGQSSPKRRVTKDNGVADASHSASHKKSSGSGATSPTKRHTMSSISDSEMVECSVRTPTSNTVSTLVSQHTTPFTSDSDSYYSEWGSLSQTPRDIPPRPPDMPDAKLVAIGEQQYAWLIPVDGDVSLGEPGEEIKIRQVDRSQTTSASKNRFTPSQLKRAMQRRISSSDPEQDTRDDASSHAAAKVLYTQRSTRQRPGRSGGGTRDTSRESSAFPSSTDSDCSDYGGGRDRSVQDPLAFFSPPGTSVDSQRRKGPRKPEKNERLPELSEQCPESSRRQADRRNSSRSSCKTPSSLSKKTTCEDSEYGDPQRPHVPATISEESNGYGLKNNRGKRRSLSDSERPNDHTVVRNQPVRNPRGSQGRGGKLQSNHRPSGGRTGSGAKEIRDAGSGRGSRASSNAPSPRATSPTEGMRSCSSRGVLLMPVGLPSEDQIAKPQGKVARPVSPDANDHSSLRPLGTSAKSNPLRDLEKSFEFFNLFSGGDRDNDNSGSGPEHRRQPSLSELLSESLMGRSESSPRAASPDGHLALMDQMDPGQGPITLEDLKRMENGKRPSAPSISDVTTAAGTDPTRCVTSDLVDAPDHKVLYNDLLNYTARLEQEKRKLEERLREVEQENRELILQSRLSDRGTMPITVGSSASPPAELLSTGIPSGETIASVADSKSQCDESVQEIQPSDIPDTMNMSRASPSPEPPQGRCSPTSSKKRESRDRTDSGDVGDVKLPPASPPASPRISSPSGTGKQSSRNNGESPKSSNSRNKGLPPVRDGRGKSALPAVSGAQKKVDSTDLGMPDVPVPSSPSGTKGPRPPHLRRRDGNRDRDSHQDGSKSPRPPPLSTASPALGSGDEFSEVPLAPLSPKTKSVPDPSTNEEQSQKPVPCLAQIKHPRGNRSVNRLAQNQKIHDLYRLGECISERTSSTGSDCPCYISCSRRDGNDDERKNTANEGTLTMRIVPKSMLYRIGRETETFNEVLVKILTLSPSESCIPKLHEIVEDPNRYYFVTEPTDCDGLFNSLVADHADGVVPEGTLKYLLKCILRAVGSMHQRGILHLDLTPDSIRLLKTEKGAAPKTSKLPARSWSTVELQDFEHAVLGIRGVRGALYGSQGFRAPEAYRGECGPWSDLYSIGVILYLVMTGRMPYDQQQPSSRSSCLHQEAAVLQREGSAATKDAWAWRSKVFESLRARPVCWDCDPWPNTPLCRDFCQTLLVFDARQRTSSAAEALQHEWLQEVQDE